MNFSMFENMRTGSDMNQRFSSDNGMMPGNSRPLSRFPEQTPIAMAYVPMQEWSETYDVQEALSIGTIFPELNLPFEPEVGCNG